VISPAIDRRRTPRHPVLQIAEIVAGRVSCYGLILDRSDGGVRVRTRSDFEAPNEFSLRFADTESRYKVVWRNGSLVGAILIH
jgi:hypothetical protein